MTELENLLVTNQRFMMYKAMHYTGYNDHDAEDLVSETIILALTRSDDWYKQTCKFTSWIRWRMLDAMRCYKYGYHTVKPSLMPTYISTIAVTDNSLDDVLFFETLGKLPFPKVAVMNEQGYFDREIAKEFGVSRPIIQRWQNANRAAYEILMKQQ